MAAQQSTACWVWCPVESSQDFKHPADVPIGDEVAAKAAFLELMRGPRLARISPATMLQTKGNLALIAEKGATREVPKSMVLPWYEGLLLLEELEQVQGQAGHLQASWWDEELRAVLEKERTKFRTRRLNGTSYTEQRLLTMAVTGTKFVDGDDREWNYRRENIKADDKLNLVDGEDDGAFFKMREIIGYLPPWEAFHDEKCGFYQDFYQIRWEHPFSEVDYAAVENGATDEKGATWEPDECLPAHMDFLRMAAKKKWITTRRQKEAQAPPPGIRRRPTQSPQALGAAANGSPPPGAAAVKRERPDDVPVPMGRQAKRRRDGTALERDLLMSRAGHDFKPEEVEKTLGQIRSGWPKKAEEYPPGFHVASPPGFCWEACDCMDDQRPQKSFETKKPWLEEQLRSADAFAAISAFSDQTRFVRRRGMVSKMCYFESPGGKFHDQTGAKAAADLMVMIERALQAVLGQIPFGSLSEADAVCIPARAFLSDDSDYEPLLFSATTASGAPMPSWLRVNADTGQISASRPPVAAELPVQLRFDLGAAEGPVAKANVGIVAQNFTGSAAPWFIATTPLAQKYNDSTRCPLERGVWSGLYEHFSEIYDFTRRTSKEKTLGAWLEVVARILRLLRTASGAGLALDPYSAPADDSVGWKSKSWN